jgi:hypothetical protein
MQKISIYLRAAKHGLAGNAAPMKAGAANLVHFHYRYGFAALCGGYRRGIPPRPASQHSYIHLNRHIVASILYPPFKFFIKYNDYRSMKLLAMSRLQPPSYCNAFFYHFHFSRMK